jgi:hypothetical protein
METYKIPDYDLIQSLLIFIAVATNCNKPVELNYIPDLIEKNKADSFSALFKTFQDVN